MSTSKETAYLGINRLFSVLGISWYKWTNYRKTGVIPEPDVMFNGKPAWSHSKLRDIRAAVEYAEQWHPEGEQIPV